MTWTNDSCAPYLHVDLQALSHNYRSLQKIVSPSCSVGCVLKANAYGLGMAPIGAHLLKEGARHFFVARGDEGISLRHYFRSLLDSSQPPPLIFVLNGVCASEHGSVIEADLIPIFSNKEDLDAWTRTASFLHKPLPYGLQFDTGIHRLGLSPRDFEDITKNLDLFQTASCVLLMSHLSNGEDLRASSNPQQKELFEKKKKVFPNALRSFAHSGGVFLGQEYHYDVIRAGIALYGIQIPSQAKPLFRQVASLRANLIETNEVGSGAHMGYGSTYSLPQGGRIGIVNIGYADGYPWSLSGKSLMIKGHAVPIAGRISMDLVTLDLSSLPSALLKKGDTINLIGEENPWEEVAQKAALIPHVLLAQMGSRLKRRYEAY